MAELSQLEKQRLANIQRNKDLLQTLQLDRQETEKKMKGLSPKTEGRKLGRPKKRKEVSSNTTVEEDHSFANDGDAEQDTPLRRSKRPRASDTGEGIGYNEMRLADKLFGTISRPKSKSSKKLEKPEKQENNAPKGSTTTIEPIVKEKKAKSTKSKNAAKQAKPPAPGLETPALNGVNDLEKPRFVAIVPKPTALVVETTQGAGVSFNSTFEIAKTPEEDTIPRLSEIGEALLEPATPDEIMSSPRREKDYDSADLTLSPSLTQMRMDFESSTPKKESKSKKHRPELSSSVTDSPGSAITQSQGYDSAEDAALVETTPSDHQASEPTLSPVESSKQGSDEQDSLHFLRMAVATKSIFSISQTPQAQAQVRSSQQMKKKKGTQAECLEIHPSLARKLVCLGDSRGHVSIWSADHQDVFGSSQDAEPIISRFKLHGKKRVTAIQIHPQVETKLYSAGWDERIACLDLETGKALEPVVELKDDNHFKRQGSSSNSWSPQVTDLGLAPQNPSLVYFSTQTGHFGRVDVRQDNSASSLLLQLGKTPILKFSLNPAEANQVATISLDRTLRIWDIRYLTAHQAKEDRFLNRDFPLNEKEKTYTYTTAHLYGSFEDKSSSPRNFDNSLLTSVDWNSDGTLLLSAVNTVNSDPSPDSLLFFTHALRNSATTWTSSTVFGRQFKYSSSVIFDKSTDLSNEASPTHGMHPLIGLDKASYSHRYKHCLATRWQRTPCDGVQKFSITNPTNNSIQIYDKHGQVLRELTSLTTSSISMVKMHPSQNWLASVGSDNLLQVWS